MPCRVGITTDPERRKREWINHYGSINNWMQWGPYTRDHAQNEENRIAHAYNCVSHPGGPESGHSWYVYKFNFNY